MCLTLARLTVGSSRRVRVLYAIVTKVLLDGRQRHRKLRRAARQRSYYISMAAALHHVTRVARPSHRGDAQGRLGIIPCYLGY